MHDILLASQGVEGWLQCLREAALQSVTSTIPPAFTDFREEEDSPPFETKENYLEAVGTVLRDFQKAHIFSLSLSVQYSRVEPSASL